METYGINHYNSYNVTKASMAERVLRTLKQKLYQLFALHGTYNWTSSGLLTKVVDEINHTVHSTTHVKPIDVTQKNESYILKNIYSRNGTDRKHKKMMMKRLFNVGDYVRISKAKLLFEKGYTPNWSTELFKIAKVRSNDIPVSYQLEDLNNQPVKGCFYAAELQKTKQPNVYLVEKVIRRNKKGNQLLVKWLGFPDSFNSYIKSSDIV